MCSVLECQDCPGVASTLTECIKLHFLPGPQELRVGPINPHLYMWTFYWEGPRNLGGARFARYTHCQSRAWPGGTPNIPFQCLGFPPIHISVDFFKNFFKPGNIWGPKTCNCVPWITDCLLGTGMWICPGELWATQKVKVVMLNLKTCFISVASETCFQKTSLGKVPHISTLFFCGKKLGLTLLYKDVSSIFTKLFLLRFYFS